MSALEPIPFQPEGPQPLMREIPCGQPFPVDALGPLKAVVEAVQDISQAPFAIAAQSALSVASLAVQGFADVETLGGDAPCSLFCLTIAESGERKSTCDRLMIGGLREYERTRGIEHLKAYSEWEKVHKIWAEKRKRLITEAAGSKADKASTAEIELLDMGPEPKEPLYPNVTAMEPTFEGLLKLYQVGRPSLGLFSDEAGGFIGGHAMNSDNRLKTMAGLSRLWNGEAIDRTRAGDGATIFRGRRLAANLMVQPVAARPLLSDPEASGQGFLARFLISEPQSHIGLRLRRGFNDGSKEIISRFSDRLQQILNSPMPTSENPQELAPIHLPLSGPAKELLWRYHEYVEKRQGTGQEFEQIRAYASKATEQAARIAAVLTLWENLNAPEISALVMGHGITLSQYYLSEAKRLADAGAISAETDKAEVLRKWILESWPHDEIIPSDVVQYGPNQLRESPTAKAALTILQKHGWLVRLPQGAVVQGKARKEAYRIVRAQHEV
ncbi:YfjI family protein [Pseudochrobactrum sp. XF203]|uniref:YfjI family protein n=1 Tax=Pseudochrobactrum sp. XF203 TaxID=2879116 RepID=UPI001CE2B5A8|nr:YfjI family protein [Pseudochrobactrum sp. XF203]UCA46888.1 DUF3987 domain-containing protein [Pseudochrobactrum sp. XF203]